MGINVSRNVLRQHIISYHDAAFSATRPREKPWYNSSSLNCMQQGSFICRASCCGSGAACRSATRCKTRSLLQDVDIMGKSSPSHIIKKRNTQKELSGRSCLQILSKLCSLPLSAVVLDASVWLTVPERVAEILHEYALGSSDGGPNTALHTAVRLSQQTGTKLQLSEVQCRLAPSVNGCIHHVCHLCADWRTSVTAFEPRGSHFSGTCYRQCVFLS